MTELARSIVSTIAYFDLFSFPLTTLELWRWLHSDRSQSGCTLHAARCTLSEIDRSLRDDLDIRSSLLTQGGFWFLRGRGEIVAERLRRQRIAERKYARARRVSRLLSGIAGVRMIAVANTLALSASRDEGDIDLFVVTKPGALWSVRGTAAGLLDLLGLRPSNDYSRDAICLSFLVSDDALNLSALALPNDPYLAQWVASLVPIYDNGGIYDAFWKANEWILDLLPNAWNRQTIERTIHPLFPIPTPPDTFARKCQWKRFPPLIREMMNLDSRVVVNDYMLKFHTNDRREEFRDRWIEKCREMNL